MITVQNLTKRYAGVLAVDHVSFTVEKGSVVGFLGPNGAGKTTTMRILTCFHPPTSGTAQVAGYDVMTRSLDVRRHVGYLPESVPLYPEMRVSEYLDYRARLRGVPPGIRKHRIASAVDRCGLTSVRKRVIGQLSKGYRQRVGISEVLVHDPPILILDEPTIGLDPHQILQFRRLILDLGRDHTIILSTHILPEVELMCDHLIVMNRGRLVAAGPTAEIVRQKGTLEDVFLQITAAAEPGAAPAPASKAG